MLGHENEGEQIKKRECEVARSRIFLLSNLGLSIKNSEKKFVKNNIEVESAQTWDRICSLVTYQHLSFICLRIEIRKSI